MSPDMSPEMSTDDGPLLGPLLGTLLICGRSRGVPNEALREFLDEIVRRVARGRGVVCLITGDGELRRLNRQFLGKDYATDVLSFPAGDGLAEGRGLKARTRSLTGAPQRRNARPDGRASIGEIAISIDRAAAQAKEHGHSLADELRILMLHGTLHLAGFDHEKDSGEMRRTEARWRKRLGLPPGLIERETTRAIMRPIAQSKTRSKNGRARP
jgi:probable rRNA maturation factor